MLWLDTPRCCSENMSEGGPCAALCLCVCLPASRPTDRPSRWPRRHRACNRAHLSEPVIASWLRDIWLKCTATDYYYPFLREQFFSLSGKEGRGGSIKLGKMARRRMNRLPGRKAGGKVFWSWSTTPANNWVRVRCSGLCLSADVSYRVNEGKHGSR